MSEIISRHRQFCEFSLNFRNLSSQTIKSYENTMKLYLEFSNATTFSQFTRKSVMDWIMYGNGQLGWSPKTSHIRLGDLKAFAKWCLVEGMMKTNPVSELPLPKLEHKEAEFFTEEEVARLMSWVRNYPYYEEIERRRAIAIFSMFILTGIRKGELLNLEMEDVRLNEGYLHVRGGKGSKDRTVLFHPSLRYILEEYLQDRKKLGVTCPNFFVSTRENLGLSLSVLARLFKKIQNASGMRVYPHKLRHTFVVSSLSRGVAEHEMLRQLGHSSRSSLASYIHVCDKRLRERISASGFSL